MAYCLLQWLFLLHPFFISVAEITYDGKDKELEVSIRIFTDDFEKTLRQNYPAEKVDLLHSADVKTTGVIIKKYVANKFQVTLNGKKVPFEFVGYEQVEENTWCYFTIPFTDKIHQVKVNNSLLYDYKKEQTNLHHVTINGTQKSSQLNYPDTDTRFVF